MAMASMSEESRMPTSRPHTKKTPKTTPPRRGAPTTSAAGSDTQRATEGMDRVRERINRIGVVERLSTEGLVEHRVALKGTAVIHIGIRLHNKHELLARVVEVKLDLVRGRTNRLVASELELLNEVLVRVLGHSAALVGVKEHVIDVERSSNQRLVVGSSDLHVRASARRAVKALDSPEHLVNRTDVKVDLNLVVLKSDQRQSKARVAAVPELKRHVKRGLRQGVARSADLARGQAIARTIDVGERRIRDVGKLSRVTDHLVVTALLLLGERELVPDVHPVTVLAVDSLATNLDLNGGDHVLTREIKPAGIDTLVSALVFAHCLVNLRQGNLKVRAVGKITIAADRASHTAAKVGLAIESLLNRLHGKVGMATVSHLPESNLWVARKIDILGAVGYELH